MTRIAFLLVLCLASGTAWASSGAEILFQDLRGAVPAEVTEAIYNDFFASFLKLSDDGMELRDEGGRTTFFRAELNDLNKDGVDEIFVIGGNAYLSGFAGSSIWLFIKNADRTYRPRLGFPAFAYEVLPESNRGFPDLKFGGPGFCQAVWRWDGDQYNYSRKEGQCGQ